MRNSTVAGDVIMRRFAAKNLNSAYVFDGTRVDDLLTTSTDQAIESTIKFDALYVSNDVKAGTINSLNFKNDVAAPASDESATVIYGRWTLHSV